MKKKFNLAKITSFALLLTVTAMILVAGTYAKYSSNASGTDATVIASWSFKVNGADITILGDDESVTFGLFDTILDSDGSTTETDVAEGLIAPGTSGAFEFALENSSDVTTKYAINLNVDNENIPIEFSFDGATWTNDLDNLVSSDILAIGGTKNVTVQWRWAFGNDTVTDTALGGQEVTVSASITATQVDNSDVVADDETDTNLESIKILAIGNSFAVDSMEYVYQIAENLGYNNITLGVLHIGSSDINTHLTNAQNDSANYTYYKNTTGTWEQTNSYKMSTAIQSEEWDYITFQQASGSSGQADTYSNLQSLIDIVKPMSNDAKLAWNMTWAYQADSTHSAFANYNNDQMTMYNAIVSAVQEKIVTNNNIDIVIPVGTAIQNARTSYLGDTLTRDGYHLSYNEGRYIAGVAFFKALTGNNVDNLTYLPESILDTTVLKIAIESANTSYANKYSVTASQFTTFVSIEEQGYSQLDLGLTEAAYYNSTNNEGGGPQALVTGTDVAKKYMATKIFTKDELPVGSIIIIADGFNVRAEGWIDGALNSVRPGNINTTELRITDEWWGEYTERAFNITNSSEITDSNREEYLNALKIYVLNN